MSIFAAISKIKENINKKEIETALTPDCDSKIQDEITTEDRKTIKNVMKRLNEHAYEYAKNTFPVWMKCNVILNSIPFKQLQEEGKTLDDISSMIDWDKINTFLKYPSVQYDYNIFDEISSIDELEEVREGAIEASIIEDMPYHKKTCKQCGEDFTLSMGQINWFNKKGLKMPCRCEFCRKGIERPKPVKIVAKTVEEPVKTSMQIAMEKAGLIL